MKKILIAIALLYSVANFAQIPVTPIKVLTEEELKKSPIDDSKNFLGAEVYGYMNQELFLPHKPEILRKEGWKNLTFVKEAKGTLIDSENIYEPEENSDRTKYKAVANKVFKVIDVIAPPAEYWAVDQTHLLYLEETKSKERMYFIYERLNKQNFPFIAMSYYHKLKKEQVGESYIFSNRYMKDRKDVKTGRKIPLVKGEAWKCTDITLNGDSFVLSLLMENGRQNTILVPVEYAIDGTRAFKQGDVEQYTKRFSETEWNKILNEEIEIGFTPEMVRLAWGEPGKKNRSADGYSWKYTNTLLHFKDGKLESYY